MLRDVPIRRKGLLVLALPVAIATVVLAVLFQVGRVLDDAMGWAMHSQEVLAKFEEANSELFAIHAENLQLALLGTSEPQFVIADRHRAATHAFEAVGRLVTDNERQSAAVKELRPLFEGLLRDLATTHEELRNGDIGQGSVHSADNDRRLTKVMNLADELRREERRLRLVRLQQIAEVSDQRHIVMLVGGAAILLGAIFLGWRLMVSMIRRLYVVRDNIARFRADEELLRPVPARDEIGRIDHAVHEMARALRAQRVDNEMFIYSVSHDLRSPLVNLQGFGKELAKSAAELGSLLGEPTTQRLRSIVAEEIPEALHYIDLAVQRQARIIDSLLKLSRIGRVDYRWEDVDLGPCINGLVDEHRSIARRSVEFEIGHLPSVRGDLDALERLFDNLIGNAVKYLDEERAGRIEIGSSQSQRRSDAVVVHVRDNGVGIAESNLERAFTPFSRFSGGEGEGIGLSLVRRVVDRHGGRVWIESQLGIGATVFVELPVARGSGRRP